MLLNLPPEILTHVLLFLPATSVLTCMQVCSLLHNLISSTAEVQYYLHLILAGLQDNPHCQLPVRERLQRLRSRESCWEALQLGFKKIIDVPYPTSGIYDLTAGVYLLGNASRRALHYAYLPTTPSEEVEWKEFKTDDIIVDMGLCVHEHDLMAIITTQRNPLGDGFLGPESACVIRLLLNQASTGKPHPQAEQPDILVMTAFRDRPAVGIEIVGDNLVLVLAYFEHPAKPDDQVFIYEWKTGKLKMRVHAPYHSYSGLLFLTKDIFLLPNTNNGTFELWNIPQTLAHLPPTQPLLVLSLPKLNPNKSYHHISCRAEPNPTTSLRHSSKPFHSDPHHAIAIFSISIRTGHPPHLHIDLQWTCSFALFIHRSSLFDCIDKFSAFTSSNGHLQPVPYDEWGPPISRWMSTEAFPTRWITTTCGQRCAIIPDVARETVGAPVILLNFNQMDVDRILAQERQENEMLITSNAGKSNGGASEMQLGSSSSEVAIEKAHTIPPRPRRVRAMTHLRDSLDGDRGCFENIVYSNLTYTAGSSLNKYSFDGVLLDEEKVLGLQTNEFDRITTVYLLHHG